MTEQDSSLFLADEGPAADAPSLAPWVVLVVDDEPEVHLVTELVAEDFEFRGRGLELLSAFSAEEARRVLEERDDIALILLDVVMETDDAGLKLVHDLRRHMGREAVRIILRTGQPGFAPEREVIVDYDINDYKSKGELTADKLFSSMVTALRGYDEILVHEVYRRNAFSSMRGQFELLRQVLAAVPTPILVTDQTGVITTANEAMEGEFSTGPLPGNALAAVCPEVADAAAAVLDGTAQDKRGTMTSGLNYAIKPHHDPAGELGGVILTFVRGAP